MHMQRRVPVRYTSSARSPPALRGWWYAVRHSYMSGMVFTMSDAGESNYNGGYEREGTHNGRPTYRKVGGGAETLQFYSTGRWIMCINYGYYGYYYVDSTAQRPPTEGWKVGSWGTAPAPTLCYIEDSGEVAVGGLAAPAAAQHAASKLESPPQAAANSVVFTVSNAEDDRFNGRYEQDVEKGTVEGRQTYRKVGGGAETLEYSGSLGDWWMCIDYGQVYYHVKSPAQLPPTEGWVVWVGSGKSGPVPTLCYEGSNGGEAHLYIGTPRVHTARKPSPQQAVRNWGCCASRNRTHSHKRGAGASVHKHIS